MKCTLCTVALVFSLGLNVGDGVCETRIPMASGKSTSEQGAISASTNQGEKVAAQMSKELSKELAGAVPLVEKLSNAVSNEYVIGAEDVLDITVWRNPDLSKQLQVRPDGRISMPIIRDIVAVGKTPTQLADEMTVKLKEYVQNPVVAVSLNQVNSSNIFLLGEVANPGKYPLKSKTTLLQGITIAGGFKETAARNQIVIFRFIETAPGMKRFTASYDDIVLRSGISDNFELKPGDTLVVPSESMVVFPGR
ncbi:MAG: polysaccharide biosynthesis/export family protein [Nitrospira sp.]|nr:polysaccharide biosynthesis/export family protein [Nitrospira sp.]MDH4242840.1 polysaccharide biosynthesis/export family protein [Nitrospira sp.]MDH4355899.1 polysaccharide biosynthesis/export family protein [Nitrospira sp.]MDH5317886.1 polysaccharide biosynthesis/export family protein [Nitrospira sp.]